MLCQLYDGVQSARKCEIKKIGHNTGKLLSLLIVKISAEVRFEFVANFFLAVVKVALLLVFLFPFYLLF